MNNKFYVGGEVLCIRTHSGKMKDGSTIPPYFIKGKKYKVNGIIKGCEHSPILLSLDGVISHHGITGCGICSRTSEGSWWNSSSFIPIDNELSEITDEQIIEEILQKEEI